MLCREEYGYPAELNLSGAQINAEGIGDSYLWKSVGLTVSSAYGGHVIELYIAYPCEEGKYPAFVYIGFEPEDSELVKKVTGSGFALCMLHYMGPSQATTETWQTDLRELFTAKNAKTSGDRPPDGCGKIMLWAQAACLAADWLAMQPYADGSRLAVIGHSRLGKTALLAGAMSERFAYVISNDSGCSGAAVTRGKRGEHLDHITGVFPYWFCKNYAAYVGRENELPFDQHFLLALSAPPPRDCRQRGRTTSGPTRVAEYLGCVAASPAWRLYGGEGVELLDRKPRAGDVLHGGEIGYHLRADEHNLKHEDWERYISYIKWHSLLKASI